MFSHFKLEFSWRYFLFYISIWFNLISSWSIQTNFCSTFVNLWLWPSTIKWIRLSPPNSSSCPYLSLSTYPFELKTPFWCLIGLIPYPRPSSSSAFVAASGADPSLIFFWDSWRSIWGPWGSYSLSSFVIAFLTLRHIGFVIALIFPPRIWSTRTLCFSTVGVLRLIFFNRSFLPLLNDECLKHYWLSPFLVLWKSYIWSYLVKLKKLLCLKYFGRTLLLNSFTSLTMKLSPSSVQQIISSIEGSQTISKVFSRKDGTFTWAFVPP